MFVFAAGAFPGRKTDVNMVRDSHVNDRLRVSQLGQAFQFWAYGDRIFNDDVYVRASPRAGRGGAVPQAIQDDDKPLRRLRCSIEIVFGKVANLWKFANYSEAQKLLLCPVALHFLNILFLCNCHTCLYGGIVPTMFNILPISLQTYLGFVWDDAQDDADDVD